MKGTTQGKENSVYDSNRSQDGNRPEKNLQEAGSFPRSKAHKIIPGADGVKGQREEPRQEELKKSISSFSKAPFANFFPDNETARRFQEEPVGQNDGDGQLVSDEDYLQLTDDHHLGDGKGKPHEKEGEMKREVGQAGLPEEGISCNGNYSSVQGLEEGQRLEVEVRGKM
jgi:hypothetical protein